MGRDEKEHLQFADPPRAVLGRQLALYRVPLRLGRSQRGHAATAARHPTGTTAPPDLPRIRLLFQPGSAHASHPVTRRVGLAHKILRSYGYRLSLLGQTAITLAFKLKSKTG